MDPTNGKMVRIYMKPRMRYFYNIGWVCTGPVDHHGLYRQTCPTSTPSEAYWLWVESEHGVLYAFIQRVWAKIRGKA